MGHRFPLPSRFLVYPSPRELFFFFSPLSPFVPGHGEYPPPSSWVCKLGSTFSPRFCFGCHLPPSSSFPTVLRRAFSMELNPSFFLCQLSGWPSGLISDPPLGGLFQFNLPSQQSVRFLRPLFFGNLGTFSPCSAFSQKTSDWLTPSSLRV